MLARYGQSGNKGLDISGQPGDPVFAAAKMGRLYTPDKAFKGAGNLIILRHSDRFLSAYAHNQVMLVSEGAEISTGQQIAELGLASGGVPMLHFEIRLDGNSVDPQEYLPAR